MSESFGQIAYEAYCERHFPSAGIVTWEKLREETQEAWNAAGRAVLSSSQAGIVEDKANPPAFPTFGHSGYSGMTLWDFYAGQALVGIAPIENSYKDTVKWAADLADAMLEERVKRGIIGG